ncbi:FAM72 protein-domain-containing protein, partial [Zopfochytrium polystomum]
SIHPQFRSKAVCQIHCLHCSAVMCRRGMKAILLGNVKVELFSTDAPPTGVQLVFDDYTTRNCLCRIRDAACLACGNVVGYHVTQPCAHCLKSCNNGHFWMFLSEGITAMERVDGKQLRLALLFVSFFFFFLLLGAGVEEGGRVGGRGEGGRWAGGTKCK